jgi:hypothetical protein
VQHLLGHMDMPSFRAASKINEHCFYSNTLQWHGEAMAWKGVSVERDDFEFPNCPLECNLEMKLNRERELFS